MAETAAAKRVRSLALLLRLAWKDLSANPKRSLWLVAIVFVSVATQAGIRNAARSFIAALEERERAGIGADLSIELYENPTPDQLRILDRFRDTGADWTMATSFVFSARGPRMPDSVPAVIKAVDPSRYPFYGEIAVIPRTSLATALEGESAIASPELMEDLGIHAGDRVKVGAVNCRVTGIIESEPDRYSGTFASPWRLIVTRDVLERSGLIGFGSGVLHRILIRLPQGTNLAGARSLLENAFPDTGIFDAQESSPVSRDVLRSARSFLAITAWASLAIGAIGIAMVSRFLVESRLDLLGVLKILGASPRLATAWLSLEFVLLGAAGGLAGAIAGAFCGKPLVWLAQLQERPSHGNAVTSILEGLCIGVGISIGLAFSTLITAARWRPLRILRRHTGEPGLRPSLVANLAAWIACSAVAAAFSGAYEWAAIAMLGLAVVIPTVYLASVGAIGLLRRFLKAPAIARTNAAVRYGLSNLCRAGFEWPGLLSVLTSVAMLLFIVVTLEQTVYSGILRSLPFPRANLFLMGVQDSEITGVRSILARDKNIELPYESADLTWLRLSGGVDSTRLAQAPHSWIGRCLDLPAGSGVILDASAANLLGLRQGSPFQLESGGRQIKAVVGAIRNLSPVERIWFSMTVPCADVADRPKFHDIGLRIGESERPALVREIRRSYPVLNILTLADIRKQISTVVTPASAAVRFLSYSLVAAGILISSAIVSASTRARRQEFALLQTLGARFTFILTSLIAEFGCAGAFAGLLGSSLAYGLLDGLLGYILGKTVFDPSKILLAVMLGSVLTVAAGLLACAPAAAKRPWVTRRLD